MPRPKTRDQELVDRCLDALRALRGVQTVRVQHRVTQLPRLADALIELHGDWGDATYVAETKDQLTPAALPLIIHQLKKLHHQKRHPLLLTRYVPQNTAEELKRGGIEFVDTAGNMYLNHPPLYVEITGRKRQDRPALLNRAFRPAGLKLIYVFLKKPALVNANYRDLAEKADIAVGAVGTVLANLREIGFIRRTTARQQELANWPELFKRWETAYVEVLRPKLVLGTYRHLGNTVEDLTPRVEQVNGGAPLIGGELAAALLTKGLRPERATLHVAGDVAKALTTLRLLPDTAGNVDILRTFGTANGYDGPEMALADPVLIHVELLRATGERVRDIAERLFKKYIAPRFE